MTNEWLDASSPGQPWRSPSSSPARRRPAPPPGRLRTASGANWPTSWPAGESRRGLWCISHTGDSAPGQSSSSKRLAPASTPTVIPSPAPVARPRGRVYRDVRPGAMPALAPIPTAEKAPRRWMAAQRSLGAATRRRLCLRPSHWVRLFDTAFAGSATTSTFPNWGTLATKRFFFPFEWNPEGGGCARIRRTAKGDALSEHPTSAELAAFFAGGLPAGRLRKVTRHLLGSCASCTATLSAHHQRLTEPPSMDAYEVALDRAFARARDYKRHLRREELRGRKVATLLQEGGLEALLAADLPFRGSGMLQALLERSWAIRYENPAEMASLARHAVEIARRLDSRYYNSQERADLQARAWGELGNALRAADDLHEAERAFGYAFAFLLQGTGELHLKARLYDLHASFLGTRRQFELAFAALDIAYTAYLELEDTHLAGRSLLSKAIYLHYSGQPEMAIEINRRALNLIDAAREPSLRFFAINNQLVFLIACGRFKEAKRELFRKRAELGQLKGRVNGLKLLWIQGRAALADRSERSVRAQGRVTVLSDTVKVSCGRRWSKSPGRGNEAPLPSPFRPLLWGGRPHNSPRPCPYCR